MAKQNERKGSSKKNVAKLLVATMAVTPVVAVMPGVVSAAAIEGTATDNSITMEAGNTTVSATDNKWVINVTTGTLNPAVTEADLNITGLPTGLTFTAVKGTGNTIDITVGGTATSTVTTPTAVNVIVKGSAVTDGSTDSAPINVTVNPAPDTTAPALSATSASGTTATGTTLNFTSDEAGTYYYLVYAAADAAPTAADIEAQGAAVAKGTAAASAGANTASVTGLSASTAYKAYVIVKDAAGNVSSVAEIAVTTTAAPDTTAPALSATSASGTTATGTTLNFTSDEAGTYYYLVYAAA
ncbi:hypothetical protein PV407_26815, partial [Paenibacillus sp. GYB003]